MSNFQTQHYYPRDAIIFNGIVDHETGQVIHQIPNRFMTYEEFKVRRIKEKYRDEGYLDKEHYDKYIGMIQANLVYYKQDISYVKEQKISILEDLFIKQGVKGCNKITRCFKNPNNKTIKFNRRFKEWDLEEIFGRPIQITTDVPPPTWQKERDAEWNKIHQAKNNINFSNEDVWLLTQNNKKTSTNK